MCEYMTRPSVGISARKIVPDCDSVVNNDFLSNPPYVQFVGNGTWYVRVWRRAQRVSATSSAVISATSPPGRPAVLRARVQRHFRHDNGVLVQIKLTSGKSIGLRASCERLLVMRIVDPTSAELVYDGSGEPVWTACGKMQ